MDAKTNIDIYYINLFNSAPLAYIQINTPIYGLIMTYTYI
jgi:hypothetical protein